MIIKSKTKTDTRTDQHMIIGHTNKNNLSEALNMVIILCTNLFHLSVRNGWSNRRQLDVQAKVNKIGILVDIEEFLQ